MVGVGSKRKVSDQENVEDVEENAEMELEDGTEMDEDDLNEELELPQELVSLSYEDKVELLAFKKASSALAWEDKLVTLVEAGEKQRDLAKLQAMAGIPAQSADDFLGESDDEEDMDDGGEEEEEEEEEEDDLFDSDEEEELTQKKKQKELEKAAKKAAKAEERAAKKEEKERLKAEKAKAKATAKSAKAKKIKKRSQLDDVMDSDAEDEQEEDGFDEGQYEEYVPQARDEEDEDDLAEREQLRQAKRAERMEKAQEESPTASLLSIQRCQARHDWILQNWREPYFAEAMVGRFVKLQYQQADYTASSDDAAAQQVDTRRYKMAEVLGIIPEGRNAYIMRDGTKCRVRLHVDFGNATSDKAKLMHVSNHRVSEEDYQRYCDGRLDQQKELWTERDVERKYEVYAKAANHIYTLEETREMARGNEMLALDNTTALEKLQRQREKAQQQDPPDLDEMERLQKMITVIEDKVREREELYQAKYQAGVKVNLKARQRNIANDLKAAENKKRRQEETDRLRAMGVDVSSKLNPFARRETAPMVLWLTGAKAREAANIDAEAQAELDKEAEEALKETEERERKAREQEAKRRALEMEELVRDMDMNTDAAFERIQKKHKIDIRQARAQLMDKDASYCAKIVAALGAPGEPWSQERMDWHTARGTVSFRDSTAFQSAI